MTKEEQIYASSEGPRVLGSKLAFSTKNYREVASVSQRLVVVNQDLQVLGIHQEKRKAGQNGPGVEELQHDGTVHPPRRGDLARGAAHESVSFPRPCRPSLEPGRGRPPGDHVEDARSRRQVRHGGAQPTQRVGGAAGGDGAALLPRLLPPRPFAYGPQTFLHIFPTF
jgi:hypothetical protein